MGAPSLAARAATALRRHRPRRLLHVTFLMLVAVSLWLLFAQDRAVTLRFKPQPVQKHLFYGRAGALRGDEAQRASQSPEIQALLRMGDRVMREERGEIFPEDIFSVDWSQFVPRRDLLHVGAIQRACTRHTDSAISHEYARDATSDLLRDGLINRTMDTEAEREALLAELRQCPTLDIYVPNGLRGQGYCEDAAVYTKYLDARLVPRWVVEIKLFDKALGREVSYHELCPYTPMVFFNAYWDGVRDDPAWPSTKPLYLMPNIEMTALDVSHYRQADVILCKTAICAQYLTLWFEQEGNPRMTKVLYHRFTSGDVATNALVMAGVESRDASWFERPKDFEHVQFIHTAGTSTEKGSRFVLNCWLSRPDLPRLDFYMSEDLYNKYYEKRYGARIAASQNVQLHVGKIDAIAFGRMIAQTAFFLCTSYMEGYGHYINHARASGGLIITPDVPPMNELVSRSSGVLHQARRGSVKAQFLGGTPEHSLGLRDVPGFAAFFDGPEICAAVGEVVNRLNATERHRRAQRARQQFFYDTAFFAKKMRELRTVLVLRPDRAAAN